MVVELPVVIVGDILTSGKDIKMGLLELIVILAIVGVALWVVNTQVPWIDANIKKIINIVVIIVIIVWVLSLFGLLPDLNAIKVGK
jgi:hypothetical protein